MAGEGLPLRQARQAGSERLDARMRLFLLRGSPDPLDGSLDLVARSCGHLAPLLLAARFEGAEVVARIPNHARQAPTRILARGLDLPLDRVEVAAKLIRESLQGFGELFAQKAGG